MGWVAISKDRHKDKAIASDRNFLFAKELLIAPICQFEFVTAIHTMPLVFANYSGKLQLCGVMGLEKGQNLFVTPEGKFQSNFIPMALKYHPFSLGASGKELYFLEESSMIVDKEDGDPFFQRRWVRGKGVAIKCANGSPCWSKYGNKY
jgi:hypothetical protein